METYEYSVVSAKRGETQLAADALTKLGRQGFRVISTKIDGGWVVWTLERRVARTY